MSKFGHNGECVSIESDWSQKYFLLVYMFKPRLKHRKEGATKKEVNIEEREQDDAHGKEVNRSNDREKHFRQRSLCFLRGR